MYPEGVGSHADSDKKKAWQQSTGSWVMLTPVSAKSVIKILMQAEPFWQKGYQNSEHLTTGALYVTQVVHRFTNLLPRLNAGITGNTIHMTGPCIFTIPLHPHCLPTKRGHRNTMHLVYPLGITKSFSLIKKKNIISQCIIDLKQRAEFPFILLWVCKKQHYFLAFFCLLVSNPDCGCPLNLRMCHSVPLS